MGASDRRRKSIFYKRADFSFAAQTETLQTLLERGLKSHRFPLKRRMLPTADEKTFHFINYNGKHAASSSDPANFLGVELFSYTEGADQSAIVVQEEREEIDVRSILPPGEDQQFLEGAVYFGVLNNHVVIMQSAALRIPDLERHLNWFFQKHTKILDEGVGVALVDPLPLAKKEQFSDAKSIKLVSPISFDAPAPTPVSTKKANREPEEQSVKLRPKGLGWKALQAMVGDLFDLPTYLNADELLKSHAMQVELKLKWVRTPDEDGSDLLSSIAHNLRHVTDELDYKIETKNGDISRDDFKLSTQVSVEWSEGRPRFDELFPQMIHWLESLGKNGRIEV